MSAPTQTTKTFPFKDVHQHILNLSLNAIEQKNPQCFQSLTKTQPDEMTAKLQALWRSFRPKSMSYIYEHKSSMQEGKQSTDLIKTAAQQTTDYILDVAANPNSINQRYINLTQSQATQTTQTTQAAQTSAAKSSSQTQQSQANSRSSTNAPPHINQNLLKLLQHQQQQMSAAASRFGQIPTNNPTPALLNATAHMQQLTMRLGPTQPSPVLTGSAANQAQHLSTLDRQLQLQTLFTNTANTTAIETQQAMLAQVATTFAPTTERSGLSLSIEALQNQFNQLQNSMPDLLNVLNAMGNSINTKEQELARWQLQLNAITSPTQTFPRLVQLQTEPEQLTGQLNSQVSAQELLKKQKNWILNTTSHAINQAFGLQLELDQNNTIMNTPANQVYLSMHIILLQDIYVRLNQTPNTLQGFKDYLLGTVLKRPTLVSDNLLNQQPITKRCNFLIENNQNPFLRQKEYALKKIKVPSLLTVMCKDMPNITRTEIARMNSTIQLDNTAMFNNMVTIYKQSKHTVLELFSNKNETFRVKIINDCEVICNQNASLLAEFMCYYGQFPDQNSGVMQAYSRQASGRPLQTR